MRRTLLMLCLACSALLDFLFASNRTRDDLNEANTGTLKK